MQILEYKWKIKKPNCFVASARVLKSSLNVTFRFFTHSLWTVRHSLIHFGIGSFVRVWHIETPPQWTECPFFLLKLQIAQGHKIQTRGLKLTLSFPPLLCVALIFRMLTFYLSYIPVSLSVFPCPFTCLQYLIFLLHLLRVWWLLMTDFFSSDGTFLGEIHFFQPWQGRSYMYYTEQKEYSSGL